MNFYRNFSVLKPVIRTSTSIRTNMKVESRAVSGVSDKKDYDDYIRVVGRAGVSQELGRGLGCWAPRRVGGGRRVKAMFAAKLHDIQKGSIPSGNKV